jgi:ATP-dependent DNA helicase RecG
VGKRESQPVTRAGGPTQIAGVEPATAKKLAKIGIYSRFDLILHLPLRYEDETRITPLAEVIDGQPSQIEVTVVSCEVTYRPRRQLILRVEDDTGNAILRFLNFYPSQQKSFAKGSRLRVFGEPRTGFFGAEMVHPRVRVLRNDTPLPSALTPVYPTTAGLTQFQLRTLIERALKSESLTDTLPDATRAEHRLISFAEAINALHHPGAAVSTDDLVERNHPAWRRVKFDELLAQQLSMRIHHRARQALTALPLAPRRTLVGKFSKALPFKLTGAQQRAWKEIGEDLARGHPMNRLLQGDVGSGKTVIAALAALRAVENNCQAVFMAPTELLAEQHYRKLTDWLTPLNVPIAWLSGSQKKTERHKSAQAIAHGEIAIAVGTHALFQDGVAFARLGLAIVDEQHRFGVRQRLALRDKGTLSDGKEPHVLTMSATPIPRTLAMSYYADLDVSVIDELPPGRTPIVTKLIAAGRRDEVIQHVRDACVAGGQAYWVCPLIEESETLDLQTAIDTHLALAKALPALRVGLVHGRLPAVEKAAVMAEFASGQLHLLVATTVIEVGVDVPNASLMVVEHAERFGLAQLHQLRGRVGRGAAQSVCVLLYQHPLSANARARLRVIFENTDGFAIAAEDLRLRGPGELLGSRQSGVPLLRFADLATDIDLLESARATSDHIADDMPEWATRHIERWAGGRGELLKA